MVSEASTRRDPGSESVVGCFSSFVSAVFLRPFSASPDSALCLLQTELLPHCADVPRVGQVVQEDGKLLMQAVLEVRLPPASRLAWLALLVQRLHHPLPPVRRPLAGSPRAVWWTSSRRCCSPWISTASLCWRCGWRRCCRRPASPPPASLRSRKRPSASRSSGTTWNCSCVQYTPESIFSYTPPPPHQKREQLRLQPHLSILSRYFHIRI